MRSLRPLTERHPPGPSRRRREAQGRGRWRKYVGRDGRVGDPYGGNLQRRAWGGDEAAILTGCPRRGPQPLASPTQEPPYDSKRDTRASHTERRRCRAPSQTARAWAAPDGCPAGRRPAAFHKSRCAGDFHSVARRCRIRRCDHRCAPRCAPRWHSGWHSGWHSCCGSSRGSSRCRPRRRTLHPAPRG